MKTKKKSESKPMYPSVCLGQMLVDYARDSGHPGVLMGAKMVDSLMRKIAERAIELKDESLIQSLKQLCYIGGGKDD